MTRQDRISTIVNLFLSKEYGAVISHNEILQAVHEQRASNTYHDAVNAAVKKCVNAGKMVESVRGVGYRVVAPDEYVSQSTKCVMSGAKKIDYGTKILLHAPVRDMSQEGVQAYNNVTDRMRMLQAAVTGAKVEISMLGSARQHPLAITGR